MESQNRLYRCSFDALLEYEGSKARWEENYMAINVVYDGDAIQAGVKATEIALKQPRMPRMAKIKNVSLYSIVVVSRIDG